MAIVSCSEFAFSNSRNAASEGATVFESPEICVLLFPDIL